jgi:5'-methylthioadenosine phosphorylase
VLAVIGGSGLSQFAGLEGSRTVVVRTPYGDPSGPLTLGAIRGHAVVFLAATAASIASRRTKSTTARTCGR